MTIAPGAPVRPGCEAAVVELAGVLRLGRCPTAPTEPFADGRSRRPVTAEHRYRLSAAIRPLLFWMGKSNVGGARIVWRADGDGRRGYELLLGLGPGPRPAQDQPLGLRARGRRRVGGDDAGRDEPLRGRQPGPGEGQPRPGKDGYLFKLNRARVERRRRAGRGDDALRAAGLHVPRARRAAALRRGGPHRRRGCARAACRPACTPACCSRWPTSSAPGSRRPAPREPPAPGRGAVQYTFNAGVYDLTVASWERVERAQYGARTYEKLVRLEFESRNREKGNTERFVFACGTEGDARRGARVRALPAEVVVQGRGRARRRRDPLGSRSPCMHCPSGPSSRPPSCWWWRRSRRDTGWGAPHVRGRSTRTNPRSPPSRPPSWPCSRSSWRSRSASCRTGTTRGRRSCVRRPTRSARRGRGPTSCRSPTARRPSGS